MKTTMNLDDEILREAIAATGIKEKTAVVHLGLRELIKKAARDRLIALGGREPDLTFERAFGKGSRSSGKRKSND